MSISLHRLLPEVLMCFSSAEPVGESLHALAL
jgi:hypothetical protein